MDIEIDKPIQSRVQILGLSAQDFRKYLLEELYVTEMELAINPGIVAKLMDDDSVWGGYVEDREDAYQIRIDDQRARAALG